jgi:hypothetical protein
VADLRISELQQLAGADLAAGDFLPVADVSASESKKITVTDFLGNAVTLIADDTLPSGKILFAANTVPGSALEDGTVTATKLLSGGITGDKFANNSSGQIVAALPTSGDFVGQLAVETQGDIAYIWNGSIWKTFKASGNINTVIGSSTGPINIEVVTAGSTVTISASLDDTTAAAQFLAGPSGGAGAVSYRAIAGADLPTATTSTKGAVVVNGDGLTLNGDQIQIDNTVAANTADFHVTQYDANGLITAGRTIIGSDLPTATISTTGVIFPGSGLEVNNEGQLNHTNNTTAGTYQKVSVDAQGHVISGSALEAADIPDISAAKITSGELPTDRIGDDAVTGAKLANLSVTQIGGSQSTEGVVTFPVAEFTGQYFFDAINGDLYLWDGNAWQAITITAGEIIYAGTFDASAGSGTGEVASLTTAGQAINLTVGDPLPAANATNNRYYLVVSVGGTITSGNAPNVALAAPDMILSNGASWEEIDVSTSVTGATQASNITVTPVAGIQSTNVQAALAELDTEKIGAGGATITGELLIGTTGALAFEGSTDNAYETYLAVVDPTADRTITFPDVSGTIITTGDTGTVTSAMLAGSIAFNKLATLTSGNILVGSSGNVATSVAVTGDVTITNAGVTAIAAGAIINADVSASAAIAFSKLASLSSGAMLVGNSSNVATAVTMSGDVTISNTGVASIASGAIVNADVNASAAIAGSKIAPDFGAQNITTTGTVSDGKGNLRSIPQNAKTAAYTLVAADAGKHISITTGGVTVPASVFSVGDAVTIYNNSGSSQTITQNGGVTLREGGTANTGNRTLAQYGLATLLCVAADTFVITGAGVS